MHHQKAGARFGYRSSGAVVSVRVDDADRARGAAIMDRSSVSVSDRAAAYRKAGWNRFDPAAAVYTADQVRRERQMYR